MLQEDNKKKEAVEIRNTADQAVFQSKKLIDESGDKMPADGKSKVEEQIANVEEALKGVDNDAIKTATEELNKTMNEIHIYNLSEEFQ